MLVRRSLCVSWITTARLLSSYLVMLPFFHWHSFCWSLQIPKKNDVSPWISQYPWTLNIAHKLKQNSKTPGAWLGKIFHFFPPRASELFPSFFPAGPGALGPPFRAGRMSPLTCVKSLDVWALMIERPSETGEDGNSSSGCGVGHPQPTPQKKIWTNINDSDIIMEEFFQGTCIISHYLMIVWYLAWWYLREFDTSCLRDRSNPAKKMIGVIQASSKRFITAGCTMNKWHFTDEVI